MLNGQLSGSDSSFIIHRSSFRRRMEANELRSAIEAILFIATEPVKVDDLAEAFADEGRDAVVAQLDEIKKNFDEHVGGFILEQTAGGWRLATRAEHDPILKKYFAKKGENRDWKSTRLN